MDDEQLNYLRGKMKPLDSLHGEWEDLWMWKWRIPKYYSNAIHNTVTASQNMTSPYKDGEIY